MVNHHSINHLISSLTLTHILTLLSLEPNKLPGELL